MPSAVSTRPRCLVCGGALTIAPNLPGLLKCAECQFITADAQLSDDELASLYSEDYFHGDEYADYISEGPELRANFLRRLDVLLELQPEGERNRLYEVGAAYGFFLDEARAKYREVSGIDISEDAAAFARGTVGVDVVAGDYLEVRFEEPLDIVCMWDTVEHLAHPDTFLLKAGRDIRPGGLVALTTGDIDSLNARLRGRRWRMIHPPTHLHYFSRRTLTRLLDRAGFDVVHLETAGNARSIRGIVYAILVLRGKREGLYSFVTKLPLIDRVLDRSLSIDMKDIMFVVGRKRG